MRIEPVRPSDPVAVSLLQQLSETLEALTGSSGSSSFDPADVDGPGALFVAAYDEGDRPVGCGAYRPLSDGVAEVKRMFAVPGTQGVGAAILAFLERAALMDGYHALWLETRLVNERAVRFYEKHGYGRIANFGKYVGRPEAVCFAKELG